MIKTIGYSALGYKSETIIPKLKELADDYDAVIIDVRANPYGLVNHHDLKRSLGDRYESHRELGHPMYMTLQKSDIAHKNIILMCAEKDHRKCHRTDVAEKMREWRGRNEQIEHLFSIDKRGRGQTCL